MYMHYILYPYIYKERERERERDMYGIDRKSLAKGVINGALNFIRRTNSETNYSCVSVDRGKRAARDKYFEEETRFERRSFARGNENAARKRISVTLQYSFQGRFYIYVNACRTLFACFVYFGTASGLGACYFSFDSYFRWRARRL